MGLRLIVVLFSLLILCSACFADTVWLTNGDRLTGNVVGVAGGKLTFRIDGVGSLAIPIAKVSGMATDAPVTIVLKDGTVVARLSGRDGSLRYDTDERTGEFALADLVAINPPSTKSKWAGTASAGLTVTNATRNSEVYNVAAEVSNKNPRESKVLSGSYLFGKQSDTSGGPYRTHQDTWRLSGQYEKSLTGRYYGFGGFRLEGDQVNDLKQRTILGGGMGFYWVRRPGHEFSAETGFNYVSEAYGGGSPTNSRITGQFSTRLVRNLGLGIELRHSADYYPSLSDLADYLLSSQFALRSNMANGMFVDFRVVMDYDSVPAANAKRLAYRYVVGLGTRF